MPKVLQKAFRALPPICGMSVMKCLGEEGEKSNQIVVLKQWLQTNTMHVFTHSQFCVRLYAECPKDFWLGLNSAWNPVLHGSPRYITRSPSHYGHSIFVC